MGAGRKTQTITVGEKTEKRVSVNFSVTAKNLRKSDLAGVIFGCRHSTYRECLSKKLFGLPAAHFSYVKNIEPGLPLFLFNYSDRKLHGIFEAAGKGKLDINSTAWTADGSESTPYAAQVKMRIRMVCQPLLEDQFKPVIEDNYYEGTHFWFELDRAQTDKLISMFSSCPVTTSLSFAKNTEKTSAQFKALRPSNAKQQCATAASSGGSKWDPNAGCSYSSVVQNVNSSYAHATCSDIAGSTWNDHTLREEKQLYACSSDNAVALNLKQDGLHQDLKGDSSYSSAVRWPQKKWSALFKEESCSDVTKEVEEFNLPASDSQDPVGEGWEWEAPCPPDYLDEKNEVAKAQLDLDDSGKYDGVLSLRPDPEFDRLALESEDQGIGDWEAPCLLDYLDENSEVEEAPLDLDGSGNYNELTSLRPNPEAFHFLPLIGPSTSLSIDSPLAKLLLEVEEMRLSQFRQAEKINSLEQNLVYSRSEIQQLKDQCRMLENRLMAGGVETDDIEEDFQSVTERSHPAREASICLVGGFDGSWLSTLDIYSPSNDMMKSRTSMSFVRSYASAAKFNHEVYVLGGVDCNLWFDKVESYNPESNQWTSRPSLKQKKGSFSVLSSKDRMFVFGGGNAAEFFSEVEMFDPNIGRWIPVQSLLHKRLAPASAELNGMLYVAGGYDGKQYLKSIERLDPRENSWNELESMNMKRGCHSLAVLNEKIYAIGGFDGNRMVSTVEVFDPRAGLWMMEEPMINPRGYFGSIVIGDEIHVIGGLQTDNTVLDKAESYKVGRGWQVNNWNAIEKRCFFSAILL